MQARRNESSDIVQVVKNFSRAVHERRVAPLLEIRYPVGKLLSKRQRTGRCEDLRHCHDKPGVVMLTAMEF